MKADQIQTTKEITENSISPHEQTQTEGQSPDSRPADQWLVIFVVVLGMISICIYLIYSLVSQQAPTPSLSETEAAMSPQLSVTTPNTSDQTSRTVLWEFSGESWRPTKPAPVCPEPINFSIPTNSAYVSSFLYPGQTRNGDFKPHGGFRFDGKKNDEITTTAPFAATLFRGSRYIESNEVQYLLDFISPCGIMFRLDHLKTLSPSMMAAVDTLPPAQTNDSRTYWFSVPVQVDAGETIATAVGFENPRNVTFDFGVYDLRQPNAISQDPQWASRHQAERETAYFAICWLENLPVNQKEALIKQPHDNTEGAISDYCKQ